jgi:hypothetical protein
MARQLLAAGTDARRLRSLQFLLRLRERGRRPQLPERWPHLVVLVQTGPVCRNITRASFGSHSS